MCGSWPARPGSTDVRGEGPGAAGPGPGRAGEDAVEDPGPRLRPERGPGGSSCDPARPLRPDALLDSAATAYNRAAASLPAVADWLRLRAAGVLADSAARASLYADVTLPAATARIRWTEALARERTGDGAGAVRSYDALGATLSAARLRLAAGPDSAGRGASAERCRCSAREHRRRCRDAIGILDGSCAVRVGGAARDRAAGATPLSMPRGAWLAAAGPLSVPTSLLRHPLALLGGTRGETRHAVKSPGSAPRRITAGRSRLGSQYRHGHHCSAPGVAGGDSGLSRPRRGFLPALRWPMGRAGTRTPPGVARGFRPPCTGSRVGLLAAIIALVRREAAPRPRAQKRPSGPGRARPRGAYWAGRAHAIRATRAFSGPLAQRVERVPQSYYAPRRAARTRSRAPAAGRLTRAPEETARPSARGELERLGLRSKRARGRRLAARLRARRPRFPRGYVFRRAGQTTRAYRLARRATFLAGAWRVRFPRRDALLGGAHAG